MARQQTKIKVSPEKVTPVKSGPKKKSVKSVPAKVEIAPADDVELDAVVREIGKDASIKALTKEIHKSETEETITACITIALNHYQATVMDAQKILSDHIRHKNIRALIEIVTAQYAK